jgi:hypothetical protein
MKFSNRLDYWGEPLVEGVKSSSKAEGAELVAENEDWYVYRIKSYEAFKFYGSKNWGFNSELDWEADSDHTAPINYYFLISKVKREGVWNKIQLSVSPMSIGYTDSAGRGHTSIPVELNIPSFNKEKPEFQIWMSGVGWMPISEFKNSKGLKVSDSLDLTAVGGTNWNHHKTPITSIPYGLEVRYDLICNGLPIKSIGDGVKVGGSLYLKGTAVTVLPDDLKVNFSIYVDDPQKIQCSDELRKKLI